MSNKKVSSWYQLSNKMEKSQLSDMVKGLGKEGKDWQYRTKNNRCAVYVRELEREEMDEFKIPHWFMWKWASGRFCRAS